jgi:hypothetical protein
VTTASEPAPSPLHHRLPHICSPAP